MIEAQKISTTTGLDAAQKALLAGSGTRTDVDQAQTRLDTVLAQEIEARQHVDFTRRTLQSLIGRAPDDREARTLAQAFDEQQRLYRDDPSAAEHLRRVGQTPPDVSLPAPDVAAMTSVTSLIMNFDGFVVTR